MSFRGRRRSGGCGGFFAGIVCLVIAGIFGLVLRFGVPANEGHAEIMRSGQSLPGTVTRVEEFTSLTVNGRHPDRIHYAFGENREESMIAAFSEKNKVRAGAKITVKATADRGYPLGIEPFAVPVWLWLAPAAIGGLGLLVLAWTIAKLLLAGTLLLRK